MRLKLLMLLVLVLILPTLALAEMMTVSFSGTEMRSAPNAMSSKVIAKLSPNTPLKVLDQGTEYYKVKDYRGRTGWVHRTLLCTSPGVVVTGDRANVRQGPGTKHPVIFQLAKGDGARFIEKQGSWVNLSTSDGQSGWVADFLVWGD